MNVLIALAVSLLAGLGIWVWDVMHAFAVADPWAQLPAALRVTFQHPQLRPLALKALVVGMVAGGGLLWLLDLLMPANRRPRVVAGVEVIAGKALRRRTREKPKRAQTEVAGVPVPRAMEAQHFLLVGRTGSGKSTAMDQMLAGALARGDRVVVIDPNAHALERFGRKGDAVLNPFDPRCAPWNLFNEVRHNYDVDWLAKSVVPDASNAAAQEWHGYAQQLLAATMRAMLQAGDKDLTRLTAALTQVPAATLPTIRGCFGTLLALGCSSADPATAELLAKGLGEQGVGSRPGHFEEVPRRLGMAG